MLDEFIFSVEPEFWISNLPSYQRNTIREMLAGGKTFEEVAIAWSSKVGSENTFFFGGEGARARYFESVRDEVRKLVCGDPGYEEARRNVSELWEKNKVAVVATIAAAVGSQLGLASAAILPVVGLILAIATKVGINAWCSSQ